MEQNLKTNLISGLILVGIVFLVSLTIFINVLVSNELKKSDFIGLESARLRTIYTRGEGKVSVVPDTAKISFSVITENKSTETALNENNERINQVINYLKEKGVEEKDIKTTGFNVRPIYTYDVFNPRTGRRERVLSSYEVINRVEIKIKDLEKISSLIDGAIRAGANEVNQLEFLVSNEEEYKKEAREKAIKQAEEKAMEIASALGVKLGRVITLSEDEVYYYPVAREVTDLGMGGAAPEVPIEAGENEIVVNVRIEYEIR